MCSASRAMNRERAYQARVAPGAAVRTVSIMDRRQRAGNETKDEFIERQKGLTQRYVDVEDRGQFQYDEKGDIRTDDELNKKLKAANAKLNITGIVRENQNSRTPIDSLSYDIPGKLRIKRNWSIKSPTMNISKEGLDLPSASYAASRQNIYRVGYPRS